MADIVVMHQVDSNRAVYQPTPVHIGCETLRHATLTSACTLVLLTMLQRLEALGMLVERDPYPNTSSVCFRCQRLSEDRRWLLCLFCCSVSIPATLLLPSEPI